MTDLVAKARQGRVNALAGLASNTSRDAAAMGQVIRFRVPNRHESAVFTSSRGKREGQVVFG